ncbi:hypothetical protein ACFFLS_12245 [Flavobacterium procerum]|uniref:DUF3800 domain-containing protein n=1 Tax=Flavobacterium procerum TaxID=1455569 RepID=A0ABV6BQT9_9FLAO
MNKIYLICDESGSKGFSDNKEKTVGEFGIFAGYFLNESNIESLKSEFKAIYDKYSTEDGKLHITDLKSSLQETLRNEVFECLKKNEVSCVFEAISVQGFNINFENTNEIRQEQINHLIDKFSFSKNSNAIRLHSELFQGLFGKAIAYYIDKYGDENINLKVITDNIDNPLKIEFEQKANELIKPFPEIAKIKAYDKTKKEPIVKDLEFKSKELQADNISKTKFELIVDDNEFTLIADILANSLLYYIRQEVEKNHNINLNSLDAIKNHPLSNSFYGLSDESNINIVSDIIYGRKEE